LLPKNRRFGYNQILGAPIPEVRLWDAGGSVGAGFNCARMMAHPEMTYLADSAFSQTDPSHTLPFELSTFNC